jgi:hypothetical protein
MMYSMALALFVSFPINFRWRGVGFLRHVEPEGAGKRHEPRWVEGVPHGAVELPEPLNLGQPDKVALSRPLERERQKAAASEAGPSPILSTMTPTLTTSKPKPLHHHSDRACPRIIIDRRVLKEYGQSGWHFGYVTEHNL